MSAEVINAKDSKGNTPLMLALTDGPKGDKTAKILIKANAQLNIQNNVGETPLILATKYGSCKEVISLIQQHFPIKPNLEETFKQILKADNLGMLKILISSDIDNAHTRIAIHSQKWKPSISPGIYFGMGNYI